MFCQLFFCIFLCDFHIDNEKNNMLTVCVKSTIFKKDPGSVPLPGNCSHILCHKSGEVCLLIGDHLFCNLSQNLNFLSIL